MEKLTWLTPHSAGKQWVEPGFKARPLHYRAPADNRHHVPATVCFRMMWELRMFFFPLYIFKGLKTMKRICNRYCLWPAKLQVFVNSFSSEKVRWPLWVFTSVLCCPWWIEHPFQTMDSALIAVITVSFLTLMKFFCFFMKFQGGLLPSCFLSIGGTYDPLCSGQC